MTYYSEKQVEERAKTRAQLVGLYKKLAEYFSKQQDLPMHGWLNLNFGYESNVFELAVFSKNHRESNRSFSFYDFKSYAEQLSLANDVKTAIEADDFEKIIELSGLDQRSGVQKYIDKISRTLYTCEYCGKQQNQPCQTIEFQAEAYTTILCGCDDCNQALIAEEEERQRDYELAGQA